MTTVAVLCLLGGFNSGAVAASLSPLNTTPAAGPVVAEQALPVNDDQDLLSKAPGPVAFAQYLSKIGAKMYGAFWCGFCTRQKALFGNAFDQINYIECDPRGRNPQPEVCDRMNIVSYPTWEINGKMYRGLRSLEELAELSGYKGKL